MLSRWKILRNCFYRLMKVREVKRFFKLFGISFSKNIFSFTYKKFEQQIYEQKNVGQNLGQNNSKKVTSHINNFSLNILSTFTNLEVQANPHFLF